MIIIYVEGLPDKVLIEEIIKSKFPQTQIDYKIECTCGYTNISLYINPSQENRDNNGLNLVIFDADASEYIDGGIIKRKQYLSTQNGFIDDIFLFPNDSDDGDIEILLEQIVNPMHHQIIESFNQFQDDIGGKNFTISSTQYKYIVPAQKSKIFAYSDILKESYLAYKLTAEIKVKKANIENPYNLLYKDFWNFNSEALQPLIDFLAKYF